MLETFFTSKVRVKLLKLFFLSKENRYHVREITRQVNEEINAVRRELSRLYKVKLLGKEKRGNRLYYFLRPDFVFYPELLQLMVKESELALEIRRREKELGKIKYVAVDTALFQNQLKGSSEVSLLLVGDIRLKNLEEIIQKQQKMMQKEINYSVLSSEEYSSMQKVHNPFLRKFMEQEVVVLIGDSGKFFNHKA